MNKKKKSSFTGSLGFVLAAAGSAVGVGNIWRFPYLAAKDGGGLFLLVYLGLVVTFGFTLLVTDVAIGRRTKENALHAFESMNQKWKFLGYLTFLVPALIMTYYSVIGGWILKYLVTFFSGNGQAAAADGYFTSFITSKASPIVFMLIFLSLTALIVYRGVEKGIERFSRIVMPGLLLMVIGIGIFSLTLSHKGADGVVRTGLDGLAVYLIPNFKGLTPGRFLEILLDAMSQLFFSLSVSMGIMITYGSYVKKEINLSRSLSQIEIFDTIVAFLAGLMIIPSVFVFFGTEGMDIFHTSRKKMSLIISLVSAAASILICLGYNIFYFELKLPNGATAQLLDLMDYISNSFLMPFISLLTCIFVGWIMKPEWICEEMEASGHLFRRKKMYSFTIRYVTPIMMTVLFLQSTGFFKFL